MDRTILDELSLNDSLTKKELAKNLGTIHQNLTRSIKRLQEQQLISFATSEVDMRQTHIKITHQGMDINNKINHSINKIWAELLNNIAQPDIQAFTNVLEVLPKQASQ
ncbi:MarR family winged helix-turn-helix transcriptional regulator [Dongshaea marina]|uniref:MarR family winged helix-turn-helix transcriptional regulator n=1 Tax=Dongshaea marina TaxID=2047966 RepID=UPI00131ED6EA|nr:MarR family transcriptional regulator [Dongshaea marina]